MLVKNKQTNSNNNATIKDRFNMKYIDKKNIPKENMSNIRIIKKNLVYVIGLTKDIANKNVLYKLINRFSKK
jgi:hypothetical protein